MDSARRKAKGRKGRIMGGRIINKPSSGALSTILPINYSFGDSCHSANSPARTELTAFLGHLLDEDRAPLLPFFGQGMEWIVLGKRVHDSAEHFEAGRAGIRQIGADLQIILQCLLFIGAGCFQVGQFAFQFGNGPIDIKAFGPQLSAVIVQNRYQFGDIAPKRFQLVV